MPAVPYHGCSSLSNGEILRGRVALMVRGECSFLSKTLNAEEYGALAVIIADHDSKSQYLIEMVDDQTGRVVNIPSMFLSWRDGFMIKAAIEKSNRPYAVINIPLNLTFAPARHTKLKKAPWSLD